MTTIFLVLRKLGPERLQRNHLWKEPLTSGNHSIMCALECKMQGRRVHVQWDFRGPGGQCPGNTLRVSSQVAVFFFFFGHRPLVNSKYDTCNTSWCEGKNTHSRIGSYSLDNPWSLLVSLAEAPELLWMRINLPGHDLLGEERQPISWRRRALSLFLNGLLLGLICIGI